MPDDKNKKQSLVYFIQEGSNGAIKIGYSNQGVEKRLIELQVGNPRKLYVLRTIEGDKKLEHELHLFFAKYKLIGEWFYPSKELFDFIYNEEYYNLNIDTIKETGKPKYRGIIKCKDCGKNYKPKLEFGVLNYICSGYSNYGSDFCKRKVFSEAELDMAIKENTEIKKIEIYNFDKIIFYYLDKTKKEYSKSELKMLLDNKNSFSYF